MTIKARYASRCAACGQAIQPGAEIEWSRGSPVRHTTCAGGSVQWGRRWSGSISTPNALRE